MKKKLLAILAHPDDETFGVGGTLAKYSEKGVDCHVAIATDGAVGSVVKGYEDKRKKLVKIRKNELDEAAKILGFKVHNLGYKDSGYIGDPGNNDKTAFINKRESGVVKRIEALIKEVKPDIVITHDETGGYFHPDHIKCFEVVTKAFNNIVKSNSKYKPKKLYYNVIPKNWVQYRCLIMKLKGQDPTKHGRNGDIDMTKIGIASNNIDVVISFKKYWDVKMKASAMHASQGGKEAKNRFAPVPKFAHKFLFSKEYFILAYPKNKESSNKYDLFD